MHHKFRQHGFDGKRPAIRGRVACYGMCLAVSASPAMVCPVATYQFAPHCRFLQAHSLDEVEEFVAISSALVINMGTLDPSWVAAMKLCSAEVRAFSCTVLLPLRSSLLGPRVTRL